jgi:hypothetical protein
VKWKSQEKVVGTDLQLQSFNLHAMSEETKIDTYCRCPQPGLEATTSGIKVIVLAQTEHAMSENRQTTILMESEVNFQTN